MFKKQKYTFISITILILVSFLTYFAIYFIQNKTLSQSFSDSTNTKFDHDTQFVRCNLNIFKPEFAFVFGSQTRAHIAFYSPENLFSQSEVEWDSNRTGGTTVYNSNFNTVLKMLKKDCSQFKKSKDIDANKINTEAYWEYTPNTKDDADEEYSKYIKQLKKEEEERIRKIESGEIKVKSTYDQLKDLGFSEKEIQEIIQEMKENGLKIYK